MRAILVPVQKYVNKMFTLETALMLARKFDSYIEGVALRKNTLAMGIVEFGNVAVADFIREEEDWHKRARVLFERFMQYHDIPRSSQGNACLSHGWLEFVPPSDIFVGVYGRIFDITVWSAPEDRLSTLMLEASLFHSGRPILIVPPLPVETLGEKVLIAWSGSVAESRAVALALPILQRAKEVIVQTIRKSSLHAPTSEQVLGYLARNSIQAKLNPASLKGTNADEEIMAVAQSLDCDLVVKGTESNLKATILGGTSRYILENTKLPLFIAH